MQRYFAAGRVAVVLGLIGLVAGCGQVQNLKAKKLFKDANLAYQQQDYKKAATLYEETLQNDPNLTTAYFYLGNSYDNLWKPARVGEPENDEYLQKAIQNYRLAAERETDPKMKKLSLEYLVAAYGPDKLNEPDQAEPLIQSMIDLDPSDPTNYFALAKMYEDSGRYDEAEATLLRAQEVRPNDPAVYMQLAGYYNRQGQFDKTMEALDMRAQREPNNPEAFYTIATFYWDKAYRDFRVTEAEKQKFAEAGIVAADRALELNPDYVDAIVYKGLLLRVQATTEKNPARQKALIDEASALQARAMELRKQKQGGA
jgi:tetratricopeptide (TPR) repeat protein